MRLLLRIVGSLCFATVLFVAYADGQVKAKVFLADVKTIFVSEDLFEAGASACDRQYGGASIACDRSVAEFEEFVEVVKRWLGKSGFTVVDDELAADGILQGRISISDPTNTTFSASTGSASGSVYDRSDYTPWTVDAWLVNQNGHRLWTVREASKYPEISFSASTHAKVEGKKLALAIKHDVKKARK